ncbi:MAG TPA: hypothetical protein VF121_05425 [Thermoanaerobaculia bacterium]|nr:hypothetical protein [Thermoanaerobaculia bacterium]
MRYDYPLNLHFKVIALAPQAWVRDAAGREVLYVKQKLFKLKEKIRVFADASQSRLLHEINADRVLDLSPRFTFTAADGAVVGAVKRRGARSLWRSTYELTATDGSALLLEEENPWIKLLDGILGAVPILGAFTGFFLHPTYAVRELPSGRGALRVKKHRSFFESRFSIEVDAGPPAEAAETAVLLGILTMVLLERERG